MKLRRINVLDAGYVEVIELSGTGRDGKVKAAGEFTTEADCEVGIIEAARQSTQGAFRGWESDGDRPGDTKLLNFLYNNNHMTPFEFSGMVIEVEAPIFVFREWHRHRTQSYNEMSARYAPLPPQNYVPDLEMTLHRADVGVRAANRQAGGTAVMNREAIEAWHLEVITTYEFLDKLYERGLAAGVPKELARITMPVGHYTRMRASANLRNWLQFLTLRMDSRAQYEIRMYASAIGELVKTYFPKTWHAFREHFHE